MKPMQIIKTGFRIAAHNKRIILYLLFAALPTAVLELFTFGFFKLGDSVNGLLVLPGLLFALLTFASAILLAPPLTLGAVYTESRAVDRLVDPNAGYRFSDIFRYFRSRRYTRGLYPVVFGLMAGGVTAVISFLFYFAVVIIMLLFGVGLIKGLYQLSAYVDFYGYLPSGYRAALFTPQVMVGLILLVFAFIVFIVLANTLITYLQYMANAVTAMEDNLRLGDVLRTAFACYRRGFKKHLTIGLVGSAILAGGMIVYMLLLLPVIFMQSMGSAVVVLVLSFVFSLAMLFVRVAVQLSTMLLLKQQREAEPGLFLPPPPIRPFYPGSVPPYGGNRPGAVPPPPPFGGSNPPVPPEYPSAYQGGGYNPPPIVPPAPQSDSPVPENPPVQEVPVEPENQPTSQPDAPADDSFAGSSAEKPADRPDDGPADSQKPEE